MFELEGKTAVVTGAASGIGAASATLFARAGRERRARLVPGRSARGRARRRGDRRRGRQRDHRRRSTCAAPTRSRRCSRAANERFGGIDIVLANAAIARLVPSAELDDERWSALLDINLAGVFRCFREAIPHLRARGGGRLLATSSVAGAVRRLGGAHALRDRQGRHPGHGAQPRARARPRSDHGQRDRAGRDRDAAGARPRQLARPRRRRRVRPARPARPQRRARGHRGRVSLPRERRGGLRDRPDASSSTAASRSS